MPRTPTYGDATPIPDDLLAGVTRCWGFTLATPGVFPSRRDLDGGFYKRRGVALRGEGTAYLYRNVGGETPNPAQYCLEWGDGSAVTLERDAAGAWSYRNVWSGETRTL